MSGRPWPRPRWLVLLLVGFRLGALLLYRPGGYVAVAPPYPELPAWLDGWLTAVGATSDLGRQLLVGTLLLPFEVATLLLLYRLARLRWSEARARRSALFWALLWLPLRAWLQGIDTVGVTLLLIILAILGAPGPPGTVPRQWLWPALALTVLVPLTGSALVYLLPFVALLLPTVRGALFAVGLMLLEAAVSTVAPAMLPPGSMVAAIARLALAAVALLLTWEWSYRLQPRRLPRPSRPGIVLAAVAVVLLLTTPIGYLEYRASRLAASPYAPLVEEWAQAPPGTILLNDWDLYDQLYAWAGGRHRLLVVSANNRTAVEEHVVGRDGPIWTVIRSEQKNDGFDAFHEWLLSRETPVERKAVEGVLVERFAP